MATRSVWLRGGFALLMAVNGVINLFEGDWLFAALSLMVALLLAGGLMAAVLSDRRLSPTRTDKS